jgi:hypothetical protein
MPPIANQLYVGSSPTGSSILRSGDFTHDSSTEKILLITIMKKKKKNTKATKAVFVNAKDNTLSYVYIKHYTDIYKYCKYDVFTTVNIAKGDVMYVDDEGITNGVDFGDIDGYQIINGTNFGFNIDGYPAPIMSNAIIMSTNRLTGDATNVKHSINQIAKMVKCFLIKDDVIVQHKFTQQILK